MKSIPLTRGLSCLVDDEDFDAWGGVKWSASSHSGGRRAYAYRVVSGKTIYLHRLIAGVAGLHVDHINGDPLDNRRANLRAVSNALNAQNRHHKPLGRSGHSNIIAHPQGFVVRFRRFGKVHYGGFFKSLEKAVVARDQLARELEASEAA